MMADRIEKKIEGYLVSTKQRPDIAFELLQLLNISDDLVGLLNPDKESAEHFGLSRNAIFGASEPKEIVDKRGFDFTAWFGEKTQYIKDGAKRLIEYWEMNPTTLELKKNAPFTKEEYIIEGIESGLHQVRVYSKTILDMIERDY
ncbi:hypothetical protein [Bacillus sp. SD088]|uniref:hypothetical protein n=1 Tax=Bacillus sp. SD088 TaxID=2782012 RepID=UPI001A967BDD|nr:hypothetical protein [Bacillus sp. SD088]MBO0995923.1 hypothetical protein [Bacillus sp. SD088]